jgi:hypothetical protein
MNLTGATTFDFKAGDIVASAVMGWICEVIAVDHGQDSVFVRREGGNDTIDFDPGYLLTEVQLLKEYLDV